MKTSIFDLFKIGIGPSSSHTVGPMRAAREFAVVLRDQKMLEQTSRVCAELYGSLALTGRGHATDRAVLLGLSGEMPDQVVPETIETLLAVIRTQQSLRLLGVQALPFVEERDLLWHRDQTLPGHPNAVRFTAFDARGRPLLMQVYYSVGGGFIVREGEAKTAPSSLAAVPYPFSNAAELLQRGREQELPIWVMMLENEKAWRPEVEVRRHITRVWQAMQECTRRGLTTDGVLPGGLKVRRRAARLYRSLQSAAGADPLAVMDWVNVFAMAVNEENAAGGRVVTAPTNGAAGIIPAVAHYYQRFVAGASEEGIVRYFLTAAAIGVLYKENASISGAEVGCQGEVGVACSMAAAGLAAALDGDNEHIEHAAEIAMEHNLGMTCDPIGGLVQIPCIERNAIGAVKAINACRMALHESGGHKVTLDQVIQTMYQTGLDMQARYKETSLAGLGVNVVECLS